MRIEWVKLREAAQEAATHAYAPYSRLRVGAGGLTSDGRIVSGCNVENASFGVTLCAECGVVSALHATATDDAPRLIAIAVVAGDGEALTPCGRCRQMLLEAGGPELLVNTQALGDLLPGAFSGADIAQRRDS